MKTCACFIAFASLMTLIMGVGKLYTAVTERELVEVRIEDIKTSVSKSKWIRITGGVIDCLSASSTGIRGIDKPQVVYTPLVPKGFDRSKDRIHVIVLSRDSDLLQLYAEMRKLDQSDAEAMKRFFKNNAGKLRAERNVEGIVRYGIDSGGTKEYSLLMKSYPEAAKKVMILEDGEKPSLLGGFEMIGGGIVGLVLCGIFGLMFDKPKPPPIPNSPQQLTPPPYP